MSTHIRLKYSLRLLSIECIRFATINQQSNHARKEAVFQMNPHSGGVKNNNAILKTFFKVAAVAETTENGSRALKIARYHKVS